MYHIIYKTTHKESGKYYVGVHSTKCLDDGYLGSGRLLKTDIKLYGTEAFIREILHICETRKEAFKLERRIVNRAFVMNEQTYNLCEGGSGHKGADRRSRTICVYDRFFTLLDKYPTFVEAAEFLDTYATTVKQACDRAAQQKSSRVRDYYVCFEGDVPCKKNTSYLIPHNKEMAKRNTGKKRPAQSAVATATNLLRPEAQKRFRFVHISGITFEGTRTELRDAFPEHNINRSELTALIHGRYKTHRGWSATPLD